MTATNGVNTPSLAVRCRGVTKDFGAGATRVQALRGVDLDVYTGEMTLLVGPSGCGKTTLLSVIAGILEPTAGSIEVLGVDLVNLSPREVVRFRGQKIGFVFQQFNLLPALSALENVAVPLLIGGMNRRQALARAEEIVVQVGLEDRMYALPADLSGGQQQRVAIARALSHRPQLLVCDEPTSALDHLNGKLIMELLRDVAVEGNRAVIVVTHDNRVFSFGDRIAHMDDGHIERVEERGKEPAGAAANS
jgi:putative ABC transport system ATP-binding protein